MIRALIGSIVAAGLMVATAAHAQDSRPALNLDTAQQMAAACLAMAMTEGWPMHVAVVDNHRRHAFLSVIMKLDYHLNVLAATWTIRAITLRTFPDGPGAP